MELLRLLNANEILAQVISFLVLLFLLRIFAWKKILLVLDNRKAKIADEFKRIEDVKAQVAVLRADYESRLAKIKEEANRKIQEAIAQGREITDEIRKSAHQEAQTIIHNARESVKFELSKAKEELKERIIDLTISASETVLQEKLTSEGDRKIINDFLKQLDEIK